MQVGEVAFGSFAGTAMATEALSPDWPCGSGCLRHAGGVEQIEQAQERSPGEEADAGRRRLALLAMWTGLVMAVLDSSLANVALPTIAREFAIEPAQSIWVVNAYQLVIVMALLPLASLGDTIGYRRVYLFGLGLFTLASLACSFSGSLLQLTLARIVQGIGAAGIMSVNLALIRLIVPERLLGRAIGWNAMFVATTSTVGPTIASALLSIGPWPNLFLVNLPFGIVMLLVSSRVLPDSPRSHRVFDIPSAVLNALTFGLLILAIDGIGHGTAPLLIAALAVFGLVAGITFVRRQLHLPAPLLPIDLLRHRIIALSVGTSVASFMAQMLAFTSLPFHFQHAHGFSVVETGLLLTAWPACVAIAAPIAGRLADRIPAGFLGGIGLVLLAIGLFLLTVLPVQPSMPEVIWRMALCGIGFGLFQTPNNRAMVGSVPIERSGAASGMLGTARLTGQTTGAALTALFLGMGAEHGSTLALLAAAVIALVAALISGLRLLPAR